MSKPLNAHKHTSQKINVNKLTYGQRASMTTNPCAKKLLELMERKQTNLALAADVTTKAELLQLVHEVGSEICLLKTHIDIVSDFDQGLIEELELLAIKYNFLILEDRKFADIGSTIQQQYSDGLYHIGSWAHMVTVHTIAGPGIIKGLQTAQTQRPASLLLLTQMSSAGNLIDDTYTQKTIAMAQEHKDCVAGLIAQKRLSDDLDLLVLTPGVKLKKATDNLGQQYNTPELSIEKRGSDIIIVGRGIYQAQNAKTAAQQYRAAGWNSYEQRLGSSN